MGTLKNPRWERFSQLLAQGKTQSEAYQTAGYKPSRANASVLKANQSIQARVAELHTGMAERFVVTRQWVIDQLVENVRRAMQAVPLRDADGNVVGVFRYDGRTANRALELLGKEIGMFGACSHNSYITTEYEKLSDTELLQQVAQVAGLLIDGTDGKPMPILT